MITRKALLIGAPGGGNSIYLAGVSRDLNATRAFLMSPEGGAWYDHEIIVFPDADINSIGYEVQRMFADYSIVLFSGHGFSDLTGNRFLSLSNGNYFYDRELLNKSPRQLVVIDSCRKVLPQLGIGDPMEEWSHFDANQNYLIKARKAYDFWIKNTPHGRLIIHSTEHDNYALDTRDGGIFTQTLLQVANNLKSEYGKIMRMNIFAVANNTVRLIKKDGYSQQPEITYQNGNINLPFALALPIPQPIPVRRTLQKKTNYIGWILGFVILGILAND